MLPRDDFIVAFLLVVGLFFPTSIGGDDRQFLVGAAFILLLGLLLVFAWRHGTRPGAVTEVSLPILIVLSACSLTAYDFRFGWGILASYVALAAVFALDLRGVHAGKYLAVTFIAVNLLWISLGAGVVFGSEWVATFLTSWYSQFFPELVPGMLYLHKPILTFGTHSLAGFFTYIFFWLNWEAFKARWAWFYLAFAICELALLVAITSFTSFAFLALALGQVGVWLWRHYRRVLLAGGTCVILALLVTGGVLARQAETFWQNPETAGGILNTDNGGLLARYGASGALSGTMDYLWRHPLSPIGFTYPTFLFLGDSGPLQYLLRGSVVLLFLVYFGLYRFLRYNSPSSGCALTLFLSFLAFEVGFAALPYFRTLFLLPFFMVYLREIIPPRVQASVSTS